VGTTVPDVFLYSLNLITLIDEHEQFSKYLTMQKVIRVIQSNYSPIVSDIGYFLALHNAI